MPLIASTFSIKLLVVHVNGTQCNKATSVLFFIAPFIWLNTMLNILGFDRTGKALVFVCMNVRVCMCHF